MSTKPLKKADLNRQLGGQADRQVHVLSQTDALTKQSAATMLQVFSQSVSLTQYVVLFACPPVRPPVQVSFTVIA